MKPGLGAGPSGRNHMFNCRSLPISTGHNYHKGVVAGLSWPSWPYLLSSGRAALSLRVHRRVPEIGEGEFMMRRPAMVTAAAVLCAAFVTSAGAAADAGTPANAAVGRTWGTAAEVPGTAALNKSGQAGVGALSCAASGDCSAGGSYASGPGVGGPTLQAYVVNETHGTWGTAKEVPGTAALNAGGNAKVLAISCATAGNCLAGGYYTQGASGLRQAFVVTETAGTWATAEEAPGTATLNQGHPGAAVTSVSCTAAGDCVAGGRYTDASGKTQAFIATQTSGTWGKAEEVPGTAALNHGGYALANSVSCASTGNCSVGGRYASSNNDGVVIAQAYVISETNGTWGTAEEVPGTAALNGGGYAEVDSVSCGSAGNCSAGGAYTTSTPVTEAFVVNETNGTWGTAEEVPGTAALNTNGLAQVNSVSCAAPGDCSAGGLYLDAAFNEGAFIVNETNGTWGAAEEVPGIAALSKGSPGATVASVSCAGPLICSAGGFYSDSGNNHQAFVVNERNGIWRTAEEVPGTASLNAGGLAGIGVLSCPTSGLGLCSAAGSYSDASLHTQAFTVNESSG